MSCLGIETGSSYPWWERRYQNLNLLLLGLISCIRISLVFVLTGSAALPVFQLRKETQSPHPAVVNQSLTSCWAYQISDSDQPSGENPNNRPNCFLHPAPLLLLWLLSCPVTHARHQLDRGPLSAWVPGTSREHPLPGHHMQWSLLKGHPPHPSIMAFPQRLVWSSNPHRDRGQGPCNTRALHPPSNGFLQCTHS